MSEGSERGRQEIFNKNYRTRYEGVKGVAFVGVYNTGGHTIRRMWVTVEGCCGEREEGVGVE
jgi:hypothetical protein